MAETEVHQAAWAGHHAGVDAAASAAVELIELDPPGAVNLRGDPADPRFLRKAGAVLGCVLPTAPNSVQTAAPVTVLWLGPDEWLVLTEAGAETALGDELRAALADIPASVVDVSGNRTRLRLTGPAARDVLAKGCPLDLHARRFGPGRCAQTVLARTTILILMVDERPTFDLFPRRSFAAYVQLWLQDAMHDHGGLWRAAGRAAGSP